MRQIPLPESDADHMHRVAICSMLYHSTDTADLDFTTCPHLHPDEIDSHKLLRMALTHDLCEAIAGDVTPHCDHAEQRESLEEAAMQHIARIVGPPLGPELAALWKEYEEHQTATAIVVKDLDKFEMLVQAFEYEQEHLGPCRVDPLQDTTSTSASIPAIKQEPLRDFFQRQQGKMKTPLFRKLDAELRARRIKMLAEKGWGVTDGEK